MVLLPALLFAGFISLVLERGRAFLFTILHLIIIGNEVLELKT